MHAICIHYFSHEILYFVLFVSLRISFKIMNDAPLTDSPRTERQVLLSLTFLSHLDQQSYTFWLFANKQKLFKIPSSGKQKLRYEYASRQSVLFLGQEVNDLMVQTISVRFHAEWSIMIHCPDEDGGELEKTWPFFLWPTTITSFFLAVFFIFT